MKNRGKYLISIDGGGTKTGICVYDTQLDAMVTDVCGGGNYKVHGAETVRNRIMESLRKLLPDSADIPSETKFLVMGLSGCDAPQDEAVYADMMTEAGFPRKLMFICNDSELIFRSLADEPGICTIAGTGTIALSFETGGKVRRAGGWGAPLSDDGSGYWIAAEMVRHFLAWIDGLDRFDPFFDRILSAYSGKSPEETAAFLGAQPPDFIADWAKTVMDEAENNELCRDIVSTAGRKTAFLTASVYGKSNFAALDSIKIVESGSLFKNALYETEFRKALSELFPLCNYEIVRSDAAPAEDGIRLARKLSEGLLSTRSQD